MTTGTLELIDTRTSTSEGDHDKFSHYVDKNKLAEAMVTGDPVTALCGKVWLPTSISEKFPVCPECAELHKLPIFKDDPKF